MCVRCEELEEEVAYLKSELGLRVDAAEIHTIKTTLGIAPGPAHLVRAMYAAHGRPMTHLQMLEAIPSPGGLEDRGMVNINTLICRIRKSLGKEAVTTVWGRGYGLSIVGMARVAAILAPAQAEAA